jgi:hypothetical protein
MKESAITGSVALSRFGRKCAKSAIDIVRVFCANLADFSPMQQSPIGGLHHAKISAKISELRI